MACGRVQACAGLDIPGIEDKAARAASDIFAQGASSPLRRGSCPSLHLFVLPLRWPPLASAEEMVKRLKGRPQGSRQ